MTPPGMISKKTHLQRKRESMAKIIKRTKKDGTCSFSIRVSNGYDREGRQVLVNRTFTPPPGLTGKKLEKELQRQADAFEQEVHNGISLDASMKVDDLIERWFTEYAEKKLKPKTVYDYRRLVPRISAGLGQLKVCQVKPSHLMAFYSNLEEQGVREDSSYTAVPALLEQLPKGKRGQIAAAAGVSERTMATLYRGGNVSRSTAEKVASAAGLPLSKAFIEHSKADGRLNGNTVQHYHRMLSSVFTKAVQWGLVVEYNGPQEIDHLFPMNREHGKINQRKREESILCHEGNTHRNLRQKSFWRYSRESGSWEPLLRRTI